MLSQILYDTTILLYGFAIHFASFFDKKANLWVQGRKNWRGQLKNIPAKKSQRVWFHCASLGEFEQARPVIEQLKASGKEIEIFISFFSPSGFEIRKNYSYADWVGYLPLDTEKNAREFIAAIQPDVVLFVKYEFWHHFLNELQSQKVPVILFSAVFRKDQIFFRWYGGFFRNMLKKFTIIFVQDATSQDLLKSITVESKVAFDTRFSRVTDIARNHKHFAEVEKFKSDAHIFIAGSTWAKDENLVLRCINEKTLTGYKYIIAPHQIEQTRIDKLIKNIPLKSLRFSELNQDNAQEAEVIIVDTIGHLAALYNYAEIAYVGGGFDACVHNILEAAVYGIPVLFGPHHQKALEAKQLLRYPVFDFASFDQALKTLSSDKILRKEIGEENYRFVAERTGGEVAIINQISLFLSGNGSAALPIRGKS